MAVLSRSPARADPVAARRPLKFPSKWCRETGTDFMHNFPKMCAGKPPREQRARRLSAPHGTAAAHVQSQTARLRVRHTTPRTPRGSARLYQSIMDASTPLTYWLSSCGASRRLP
eukprot:6943162-Prymnesium_polylepis.1